MVSCPLSPRRFHGFSCWGWTKAAVLLQGSEARCGAQGSAAARVRTQYMYIWNYASSLTGSGFGGPTSNTMARSAWTWKTICARTNEGHVCLYASWCSLDREIVLYHAGERTRFESVETAGVFARRDREHMRQKREFELPALSVPRYKVRDRGCRSHSLWQVSLRSCAHVASSF